MLAPERARVASSRLRILIKGVPTPPEQRIVHGSCPGQVSSKKTPAGQGSGSGTKILAAASLATFRRKKPFSDDRATDLGARTRRQVAADKL